MRANSHVLQVVGYQNSGKTTLVCKIVEGLTKRNCQIGTIKHHGHEGTPIFTDTNKDTFKHRYAGAAITGIEGRGTLQINTADQNGFTLAKLLELYHLFALDLIIVEGFKNESFPKIVLLRTPQDEVLLKRLSNIVLIICWYDSFPECSIPIFSIQDEHSYITWIQSYMKKEKVI